MASISTTRRSRCCARWRRSETCRSILTHERRCCMSGTFHIHHLDPMPESEVDFVQSLLPDGFTTTAPAPDATSPATDLLATADAIVTRTQPVTTEVLAASPNAKLVQKYGGRPDRLD